MWANNGKKLRKSQIGGSGKREKLTDGWTALDGLGHTPSPLAAQTKIRQHGWLERWPRHQLGQRELARARRPSGKEMRSPPLCASAHFPAHALSQAIGFPWFPPSVRR